MSALLPSKTNGDVERALQAYDKKGIILQGLSVGTLRFLVANYLNYKGPPDGRPFYNPFEDGKVLRLPLYTGRPPAVAGVPKPYICALVSACMTQGGEIVAVGDVLTNL